MARASEILRRIDTAIAGIPGMVNDIASRNTHQIREIQLEQLLQGRNSRGEYMTPSILDDPYFKGNKLKAWKYAEMKQKITPETPFGVANLFITGYYHGSILVNVQGQKLVFDGGTKFGPSIALKYNNLHLGLSPNSKKIVFVDIIRRPLYQGIRRVVFNHR